MDDETTVPVSGANVDGGNAREAERNLQDQTPKIDLAAYQGLQRVQGQTAEENKRLKAEIDASNAQLAEIKRQLDELTNSSDGLNKATEQLKAEKEATSAEAQSLKARLEMYEMVGDFQYLDSGILGTLQPRESAEATREMLKEWDSRIGQIVQKRVASEMQGVTPTGNVRGNTPSFSVDQLREMALKAVDKNDPNKGQIVDAYYSAIRDSKQYELPKPVMGAYDDIF